MSQTIFGQALCINVGLHVLGYKNSKVNQNSLPWYGCVMF